MQKKVVVVKYLFHLKKEFFENLFIILIFKMEDSYLENNKKKLTQH